MLEHDTYDIRRRVEDHRERLLREAAQDRLLRQIKASRPNWQRRAMRDIGGLLIAIGEKLQEPYCLSRATKAKAH